MYVPDVVVQVSAVGVGQPLHVLANGDAVPEVVVHAAAVEGGKRPEHGIVDHHAWATDPRGTKTQENPGGLLCRAGIHMCRSVGRSTAFIHWAARPLERTDSPRFGCT